MEVYWLEQTESDVPRDEDWLRPSETATLHTMRFPKRRADWLLGRWTAKKAFAICFGHSMDLHALREIEIRAAPSGAPKIFFRGEPSTATMSLSHRAGTGACALVPSHALLGCDLEVIEPHGDAFAADYFTLEEQAAFAKTEMADRLRLVALFWSSKESALKALGEGLRMDTRSMIVSLPFKLEHPQGVQGTRLRLSSLSSESSLRENNVWNPLEVRSKNGRGFHGWWGQSGNVLRTVLGSPPPDVPILLTHKHCIA